MEELKSKMKEIQNHIYKFVASKNSDSLENEIAEVQKLKDEIYLLYKQKTSRGVEKTEIRSGVRKISIQQIIRSKISLFSEESE